MHEIKATDNLFSELSTVVQIKAEMQGSNPGPDAQSARSRHLEVCAVGCYVSPVIIVKSRWTTPSIK